MSDLVRVDSMTCGYQPGQPVLSDVDLTVRNHDFIGVVGPSGCGKTTLLRALFGSVPPTRGSVERRHALRIGYVPQVETIDWQFPVTVAECVLMARSGGRVLPWRSAGEVTEMRRVLERLNIAEFENRHIRALSGGQQQRVFVARALMQQPELLLLDEPASGVDVNTRHEVLHLLDELHENGLPIVLTTHDLNGIATHLPNIVCLNRTIVAAGSPREVLTPEILEQTYGARMEVLQHAGLPVVVDSHRHHHRLTSEAGTGEVPS